MTVSSVVNLQSKLAQSLVIARSAKGAFSSALASATTALSPTPSAATNAQQNYGQSLTSLQNQLNGYFQTAGIDTTQEIQLSVSTDGTVQLANNHPDAAKIQQVLANHPELSGLMQSLSGAYKLANPTAAAASDSSTSEFIVSMTNGQATGSLST